MRNIEDYFNLVEYDYKFLDLGSNNKKIYEYECENLLNKLFNIAEENHMVTNYYDFWSGWKKKSKKIKLDLDDSNGSNPFVRIFYYMLWGKRIELGKNIENSNFQKYGWDGFSTNYILDNKILWGGECINTIAKYNHSKIVGGKAIEDIAKNTEDSEEKNNLYNLCKRAHQIGNFVLVPAYFNQWKGIKVKDFMDIALYCLKYGTKDYSLKHSLESKLKDSKNGLKKYQKVEIILKEFKSFSEEDFSTYINLYFLWDYVHVDKIKNKYMVLDMKKIDIKELKENITEYNLQDIEKDVDNYANGDINIYIKNANRNIMRRNVFMATMLFIANEFKENDISKCSEWKNCDGWKVSNIYKLFMYDLFLKENTRLSSFEETLSKLEEITKEKINKEDIKNKLLNIFETTRDKLEEYDKAQ